MNAADVSTVAAGGDATFNAAAVVSSFRLYNSALILLTFQTAETVPLDAFNDFVVNVVSMLMDDVDDVQLIHALETASQVVQKFTSEPQNTVLAVERSLIQGNLHLFQLVLIQSLFR